MTNKRTTTAKKKRSRALRKMTMKRTISLKQSLRKRERLKLQG
jgi:hypothetical protein